MDLYKSLCAQNSSVKTLFHDISPNKSSKSNDLIDDYAEEAEQTQASIEMTCYSSTTLTRNEEVKKDQGTSIDSTLTHQQLEQVGRFLICYRWDEIIFSFHMICQAVSVKSHLFYTPSRRRYFGWTPPNPQLYNRRLRKDYIDWYMNVYLEEDFSWEWVCHYVNHWKYSDIRFFLYFCSRLISVVWKKQINAMKKKKKRKKKKKKRSNNDSCFSFTDVPKRVSQIRWLTTELNDVSFKHLSLNSSIFIHFALFFDGNTDWQVNPLSLASRYRLWFWSVNMKSIVKRLRLRIPYV